MIASAYSPDPKLILLTVPPVSAIIEQIIRWRGARYSKAEKAYLLTATPDTITNLDTIAGETGAIHLNPDHFAEQHTELAIYRARKVSFKFIPILNK
jgi:hypothetical protein